MEKEITAVEWLEKEIEKLMPNFSKLWQDEIKQAKEIEKSSMEAINHPPHYADGKIEVIDFIEDKNLNFNLGNVVKYVARAGKKDKSKELEDLQKAIWYLQREINSKK